MQAAENFMHYVDRLKEDENKLMAIGHVTTDNEKERALLRRFRAEFEVTSGTSRVPDNTVQEEICQTYST